MALAEMQLNKHCHECDEPDATSISFMYHDVSHASPCEWDEARVAKASCNQPQDVSWSKAGPLHLMQQGNTRLGKTQSRPNHTNTHAHRTRAHERKRERREGERTVSISPSWTLIQQG